MLNKLLPQNTPARYSVRRLVRKVHVVPARLRRNFTSPTPEGVEGLRRLLRDVYFPSVYSNTDMDAFFGSADAKKAFANHLSERLDRDRYDLVPWIDSAVPLRGAKVLEIGCGTGSGTVALAEQGAEVVGLDLSAQALEVARFRAEAHGLERISFVQGNAQEMSKLLGGFTPDLIIFLAVIEHMTLAERRAALREAWGILPAGKFLCITETPNRLWFYDGHTSHLPFFHWLPDELAMEFARFSPRFPFNTRFNGGGAAEMTPFLREGRGFSFHELELALAPEAQLRVVSDQTSFLYRRNPLIAAKRLLAGDGRRERLLHAYAPNRDRAFFRENINIIIQKLG